ncbi:hypothetical protein AB9H29_12165 [Stenotrophomonas sepilia]|uniref:hypothetical protein n=1 Tax=Stenotrophomonas sepilia TaxID=2860290 RepID=UPI003558B8B1
MTTSVDVLAVLERLAAASCDPEGGPEFADIEAHAARGAVAEMIEAVEADLRGESFDSQDEKWSDYSKRRRQERNRVANALASVKGA